MALVAVPALVAVRVGRARTQRSAKLEIAAVALVLWLGLSGKFGATPFAAHSTAFFVMVYALTRLGSHQAPDRVRAHLLPMCLVSAGGLGVPFAALAYSAGDIALGLLVAAWLALDNCVWGRRVALSWLAYAAFLSLGPAFARF